MAASYLVEPWSGTSSESSGSEDEGTWGSDSQTRLQWSGIGMDTQTLETSITSMISLGEPTAFFQVTHLKLNNNVLTELPDVLGSLTNLTNLDLSNNQMSKVSGAIATLSALTHLYLRNNQLDENGLPKDMIGMKSLRTLNLSGNRLTCVPPQLFDLSNLRNLFLGANHISSINPNINRCRRLRLLYLGGNQLKTLPPEIGDLSYMQVLLLSDNKLISLPETVCNLRRLQCLHLHMNKLTTLPSGLIHLRSLSELSLRENPLVMRFIREMDYQPSSLLELAGRVIKTQNIEYQPADLPLSLHRYLNMSHECKNPSCNGVYFDHRVEHVKFSDFCGKYKVPLLQYLCSPTCGEQLPEYADCEVRTDSNNQRLKRVLLG